MKNLASIVIVIILNHINAIGQIKDLVKCDSITYSVHKANIGTIAFMGPIVPIESFKETDFLTTFIIKENWQGGF